MRRGPVDVPVHLGRVEADFRLLSALVKGVFYRGQPVAVHADGDYLVRTLSTGVSDATPRGLHLRT